MADRTSRRAQIIGWTAVVISVSITGFWAFWGTLEAFHEGWWKPTLGGRLLQTLAYHGPMLIMLTISLISARWPRIGGIIYFIIGTAFSWFIFSSRGWEMNLNAVLSWLPVTAFVVGVGVLWWFGRPRPRKWVFAVVIAVPLLISLGFAVEPLYRISGRSLEVQLEAQVIRGNGVELMWAPAGPGWSRTTKQSARFEEALDIVARLNEDGTELLDYPVNIWRLPTIDEVARSATRHGENCGGYWDEEAKTTVYRVKPDKEAPLWDPVSEIIYWWTATEGEDHAYIYIFDGRVDFRSKTAGLGSQGFRAVKDLN